MPKEHLVNELFDLLKFEKLVKEAPLFLSIFFHFLTSQTLSEDDNSNNERLNPLLP